MPKKRGRMKPRFRLRLKRGYTRGGSAAEVARAGLRMSAYELFGPDQYGAAVEFCAIMPRNRGSSPASCLTACTM